MLMPGRVHTREFKLQVVRQIASGEKRPAQVCREHQLANSVLARQRAEYAERGEAAFTPRVPSGSDTLEARIAELERCLGQLTLENSILKKALAKVTSRSDTR
jgi:transposase-like protein